LQKINEQKLQAFTIGAMGKKPISRKEQEELKKKQEEQEAAEAFKEFVETFQQSPAAASSKVWVKAGTYDAGTRKEDHREKGKLYKPTPKIGEEKTSADKAQEYAKFLANETKKDNKKKGQEKKKSNLELFKEELRQMQEEREERHKYKHIARSMIQTTEPEPIYREIVTEPTGSFDTGDPNTTNLYLGNLNPKITEQQLMELFGKYGPLASVKIMWPRSEEEKSRGRNCGFVAFMSRKDAERALRGLAGKDVMNYEMKLGWGKAVPIMSHPIYIPPALQLYAMPPPKSGLPFNAQPLGDITNKLEDLDIKQYAKDDSTKEELDEILKHSIVKVVVPTERPLLMLIHRMIEFVIREGPMFEAIIMNRELNNPAYRFLYENESPAHIYYRWKLFSLLQGDTVAEWKEKEFRMFEDGSIWRPPPLNFFSQGMPVELIDEEDLPEPNKGQLSVAQRNRLEDLLRHLTPERNKIADAMIFCIEHADAADEICECIAESLSNVETLIHKKIARIYLVSDILHNCSVKVQNASFFRKSMERNLLEMFRGLSDCYKSLESRLKAEGFKVRIMKIFRTWEEWAVYPRDFLIRLQNTFLGIPIDEKEEDVDGVPLSDKEDEDLDGVPLDGAALLKSALLRGIPSESPVRQEGSDYDEDIDGIPMEEDIDGIPMDQMKKDAHGKGAGFVPSKWETIDPEQVKDQAVTTSKWDLLEPVVPEAPKISAITANYDDSDSDSDSNSREFDDERRTRLRELELKVVEYADELESGQRSLKSGMSIGQQIEHYRKKLLKKVDRQDSDSTSDRHSSSRRERVERSVSPVEVRKSKRSRKGSSSPEYIKGSRRSRSPHGSSSSRSK
jgi:U2-associated protein SR140